MRFLLTEGFWALDQLNPFEWHLLAKLPETARGIGLPPGTRERLFPPLLPTETLADEETLAMVEDWSEFTRPEIASRFESERDLVEIDLSEVAWVERTEEGPEDHEQPEELENPEESESEGFEDPVPEATILAGERYGRVTVATDHTDAWYSALNQARILLHEAHQLADAEERRLLVTPTDEADADLDRERLYLVAQYEFYSALQGLLVEHVMRP